MHDKKEKKFIPFRTKITLFGLLLVFIVALPLLYFELQRPWDELKALVGKSETLMSGVAAAINDEELVRMNEFAEETIDKIHESIDEAPEDSYLADAYVHSFSMLLEGDSLFPEEEILAAFEDEEYEYDDYSYELLGSCFGFWQQELAEHPGLLEIFRKYRNLFLDAKEYASESGFELADIYLIFDKGGQESGFFKNNLAFLVDAYPWYESAYPGDPFDMEETDNLDWRTSYDRQEGGSPGFYSNYIYDPENWYLPEFDVDEWGTWFTVWLAMENKDDDGAIQYNTLNIDFDASRIKDLMFEIGIVIIIIGTLLAVIIFFTVRNISRNLTMPIGALIEGSEAVMQGRTDHEVPIFGNDEFRRLVEVFNQMTGWVREKVNLKDTLSKMLSEELAEKAAQEGLVLGGQEVECSIIFTDFAGFSSIVKDAKAEDVVELLNLYFSELIPIIKKHGGFPDKFIGDAIVAIFGAPVHFDNHAECAVQCAIEMQKRLRELNDQRRQSSKVVFEMRVGINSGLVIAGAIGCDLKMEYTSIGETTNLAQRMESICKIGHILVSENTYRLIKGKTFEGIRISETAHKETVKGYSEPVNTYSVLVHNQTITKNNKASTPNSYYIYETIE
jgi:class 3 adenylate cyclase